MSRATRAAALISACAATGLCAYNGRALMPSLPLACVAAWAAAAVLSRWRPAVVLAAVLPFVYLSPALFLLFKGNHHHTYALPWIAALLGVFMGTAPAEGWSAPARWRWPLAAWALIVALSWPIVAWRELDFTWPVVWDPRLPVANLRMSAPGSATWTAFVALVHLVGLLWFDWLWRRYSLEDRRRALLREAVAPLAVTIVISCAVGVYQGFVDIAFLSGHVWPTVRRAAGTMMDANAFGMLAAMWAAGFLIIALSRSPALRLSACTGLVLAWAGLWTSGSRTALLAAIIGSIITTTDLLKRLSGSGFTRRWKLAIAAAAVIVLFALSMVPSINETAVGRARHLVPTLSAASVARTARILLWDRDGYGTAANAMISEHPFVGVGLGTYHILSYDYAREMAGVEIGPDNAQNWFRHQLAELGLIGSIGWILWVAIFATSLRWSDPTSVRPGAALRGPLLGFAFASLLGMPGQEPAVVLTFWLFVVWYSVDVGAQPSPSDKVPKLAWVALVVLAFGYAAARLVPDDLRPPVRAARFDFFYTYGFQFESGGQAWSARHGVTVQPSRDRWMRLTVWAAHPDADRRPVKADVWVGKDHVIDRKLARNSPLTAYVRVPGDRKRVMLEAKVDRTFRAGRSVPSLEDRDLGLAMRWDFLPERK